MKTYICDRGHVHPGSRSTGAACVGGPAPEREDTRTEERDPNRDDSLVRKYGRRS